MNWMWTYAVFKPRSPPPHPDLKKERKKFWQCWTYCRNVWKYSCLLAFCMLYGIEAPAL